MANTYTSLQIHVVFSTKNREPWITPRVEDQVWSYLGGICRAHGVKAQHVGGVDDHVHLLVGFPPTLALSEWMKRLKGESSKWISDELPQMRGFAWQDGYAAFSVGQSQADTTIRYISKQRDHHRKTTFAQEYRKFVEKHGLLVDDRYLLG
jgi:REP element-mobilizing transposase RayT